MKYRPCIVWSLRAGVVLVLVLVIAASLWGLLAAMGDDAGAHVAGLVALVAVVGLFWNFVSLVVLQALAFLALTEQAGDEEPGP